MHSCDVLNNMYNYLIYYNDIGFKEATEAWPFKHFVKEQIITGSDIGGLKKNRFT